MTKTHVIKQNTVLTHQQVVHFCFHVYMYIYEILRIKKDPKECIITPIIHSVVQQACSVMLFIHLITSEDVGQHLCKQVTYLDNNLEKHNTNLDIKNRGYNTDIEMTIDINHRNSMRPYY